jgi:DNA-binding LacI/PurR family transcriptional regulator
MARFQEDVGRVKDHLRAAILRAELPEGAPVQEEVLRSETGASVRAVKQALRDLSAEGLIRRKRHAGTRVSEKLPSIICAVLPPIRSVGIISAYAQPNAAQSEFIQTILKGVRSVLQQPANVLEIYNPPGASVGLDDIPTVDVESVKRTVQGLIAIEATGVRGLNDLVRVGIPVVAVDFNASDNIFDLVTIDHMQAGYLATLHLLGLGHRHIAYIGEGMDDYSTDPAWQYRLTGYLRAMAIRSGPTPPTWILDVRREARSIKRLLPDFYRAHQPTAYVLGSGGFAETVVSVMGEMGLQCPRDYSLVSADHSRKTVGNLRMAEAYASFEELGRTAVRLLASRLACRPMPTVQTILQVALIPGETTAPCKLP